nr:hypothetical protein [Tanacetum cinerariifolium]
MNMDKAIKVSCIIDKLPLSWKDFKHILKHLKEELTLIELGSHLRIEKSLRVQDSDKPKGNNVIGPLVVNMVEQNNSSRHLKKDYKGVNVGNKANGSGTKGSVDVSSNLLKGHNMFNKSLQDEELDKFKVFKTEVELQQGSQIKRFRTDRECGYMDTLYFQSVGIIHETTAPYTPQQNGISERKNRVLKEMVWGCTAFLRLPDPKLKTLDERGIECIFIGYAEHSKAFRFYVIIPNDSVLINSIIESRDVIFDENSFSSLPRPSQRSLKDKTKDIGGSVNVALWKEAINDDMDSIMGNNTWVLVDLPLGFRQKSGIDYFDNYAPVARISTIRLLIAMASIYNMIIHQMDVKTTFLNEELEEEQAPKQWHQKFDEVVLSNGYLLNQAKKCVYSKFDESVSTPIDTSEELMPNNSQSISQLKYSRVIGCLMYAMTCTRPDIVFAVSKLSRYTSNLGTEHWQAIQRALKYLKKIMDYRLMYTGHPSVLEGYTNARLISNTEDNSTSGWVFLLGGGVIS